MEEALKDFTSAGVDVPSTGQSQRRPLLSLPRPEVRQGDHVAGSRRLRQREDSRVGLDTGWPTSSTRGACSPSHYELKEPITDAYTLARFAKINTGSYADTRELAREINRKIDHTGDRGPAGLEGASRGSSSTRRPSRPSRSTPDYILGLYEEIASVAKLPVVVHACGDAVEDLLLAAHQD